MGWKPSNREFHWDIITRSTNWMGRDQSFSLLVSMGLSTNHGSYKFNLWQGYLRLAVGISVGYNTGWGPAVAGVRSYPQRS